MRAKKIILNTVIYIFLIAVLFVVVVPLIYTVASSFKTNSEIMAHPEHIFPEEFTFDNYINALTASNFDLPLLFKNSLIYTAFTVTVTLMISSVTGYVFARGGDFAGGKVIFALFSSLMFVSIGGGITIYPTFEILRTVGLSGSLYGLMFMKFFSIGIVNIYLVRSYVRTLPRELDEAAEIDGCSFLGTFFRIILPLLKPLMATLAILSFQGSWNEYLMPTLFTISKPEQRTLIVGIMALKNSGEAASNWNLMLAGSTVALIPVLVVYAFANKYFVDGLAIGAVKG